MLLAAGAQGKRLALPNARILIHQPALSSGDYAQASDIQIHADEALRMRNWLEETISFHSNRDVEQVRRDIERDKILTAAQALEYGLVDQVLEYRKGRSRVVVRAPFRRPRTARSADTRWKGADTGTPGGVQ